MPADSLRRRGIEKDDDAYCLQQNKLREGTNRCRFTMKLPFAPSTSPVHRQSILFIVIYCALNGAAILSDIGTTYRYIEMPQYKSIAGCIARYLKGKCNFA